MKILFAAWLITIYISVCTAQSPLSFPPQLFFKYISTEQGLPQPTVNAILKDSRGFMWFATEDGLCRYDGNDFRIFRHQSGDSTSLSHDVVHFIEEEEDSGNLWIGTVSGLSYFNRYTERFTVYGTGAYPGIIYTHAAADKKRGRLWLSCGVGGLRYLDLASGHIVTFKDHGLDKLIAWTLALSGDSLFIGTLHHGLKVLDLQRHEMTTLAGTSSIRSVMIGRHNAWFGTEGHGLGKFDLRTNKTTWYTRENGSLNNNNIWALAMDPDENLWIGTDGGGLNILPAQQKKALVYTQTEFGEGISSNTVRSIYIEKNGDAWLGTYNGGVNYHAVRAIRFLWYRKEFNNSRSMNNNVVISFAEAEDGTIWVGTDGGGLHYLKNDEVHYYKLPTPLAGAQVITSLFCDGPGLWVGTYRHGLIHLDGHGGWKQYQNDPRDRRTLASNTVWCIAKDSLGCLWLGTDRGANRFDPATQTFHNIDNPMTGTMGALFKNIQAQAVLVSSDNTLWVGSYGLLTAYFPAADSVADMAGADTQGHPIGDLRVKAIREDRGAIWIGTYGNGLCRYDPHTNEFSVLDEQDGLPNNVVLSIEKDRTGDLWLATNKGLVHYEVPDSVFNIYNETDGLRSTIFNRNASLRTKDGRLLFGTTRGFTAFRPEKTGRGFQSLAIVFTALQLFNEPVIPGSPILAQSITETSAVKLPYNDSRAITLRFSALNFSSPEKVTYTYNLAGFSDEWQPVGKDHSVTFTNLDPGTYTLNIRASFNGRVWGPEKKLSITIETPWWMTGYFRLAMFITACTLAYSFYRYRTYRLNAQKEELQHLVNEQSREIKNKNDDLMAQNEELTQQNEQMSVQKETIAAQNLMLQEAQQKLKKINESLEIAVYNRTEKLNETIIQLNKTIKELDGFVYSASHDLIAPLKSVLGLVHIARKENADEGTNLYLDHIELSVGKLENVIKNMIHYSRNSRQEVVREEVNLKALIDECLADVQFMPGAETLRIEADFGDGTTVYSDPQRLKIIVGNLLSNTVKYRDPRKPVCITRILFEKGKTTWRLEVYDNGIGIDKKYLSRVFEMFYRATDRAQGSGLGLYIVKETVERLYGKIYVDSEKGAWTRFVVTIPNSNTYIRTK